MSTTTDARRTRFAGAPAADTTRATELDDVKQRMERLENSQLHDQQRRREQAAHDKQTLQTLLHNVANHSGDLTHANRISEAASTVGTLPRTVAAISTPGGKPTVPSADPPDTRWKLTAVPPNDFDEFSPEFKLMLKKRDNITTREQYDATGDLMCNNCDPAAPNMPHRRKSCTVAFATTKRGQQKMNNVSAARANQRLKELLHGAQGSPRPSTYSTLAHAAMELDADDDIPRSDHLASCVYYQQALEASDDMDADLFVAGVEGLNELVCQVCQAGTQAADDA